MWVRGYDPLRSGANRSAMSLLSPRAGLLERVKGYVLNLVLDPIDRWA